MTYTQQELLGVLHRMRRERAERYRKVQSAEWELKKAHDAVGQRERELAQARAALEAMDTDLPGVRAALLATGMDENEMERSLSTLDSIARSEERKAKEAAEAATGGKG
ncbi:MAG TPA: hypothetical protein VD948_06615 [Rhodothermales bacterium]|nr:hypothetical protein [Rhodothermales bacterium]